MAARCQNSFSLELATGNWQPDAKLILEDFIHFLRVIVFPDPPPPVQRQPDASSHFLVNCQLAARYQLNFRWFKTIKVNKETGKRQRDANSQILVNWQLATGSQTPIRFQRISDD